MGTLAQSTGYDYWQLLLCDVGSSSFYYDQNQKGEHSTRCMQFNTAIELYIKNIGIICCGVEMSLQHLCAW